MNGVNEIVENDPEANALEWAAGILQRRLAEVIALRDDALNAADIEGVHQMRVAIRRLRSALRDFAPLLKTRLLKKSNKNLKNLAVVLGRARDEDVALAALERLCKRAKNEKVKAEITAKIEKRRATRQKTQNKLEKILEMPALEHLREGFAGAIEEAIRQNEKNADLPAEEAGREIIFKGLNEFIALSGSLYDPFNQKEMHELRIAAKRLRYALELFSVFWGEKINRFAKQISRMQTFLGELHDCDIWIESLTRRLKTEKKSKQPADFWLLSRFTRDRTKNYRAALRLWSKWQKDKFVKKLRKVLEREKVALEQIKPADTTA